MNSVHLVVLQTNRETQCMCTVKGKTTALFLHFVSRIRLPRVTVSPASGVTVSPASGVTVSNAFDSYSVYCITLPCVTVPQGSPRNSCVNVSFFSTLNYFCLLLFLIRASLAQW